MTDNDELDLDLPDPGAGWRWRVHVIALFEAPILHLERASWWARLVHSDGLEDRGWKRDEDGNMVVDVDTVREAAERLLRQRTADSERAQITARLRGTYR